MNFLLMAGRRQELGFTKPLLDHFALLSSRSLPTVETQLKVTGAMRKSATAFFAQTIAQNKLALPKFDPFFPWSGPGC